MLGTFIGSLPFANDAVSNTKVTMKAGRGQLFALKLVNTTAATAYLQLFDKAAADVTVGTTAPDFFFRLAANESVVISTAFPYAFANGLVLAGTTTSTGNTGAAISVTAFYE